jgi:hypothetical protein
MPANPYPILELELVLVRDTTNLTVLNYLPKLVSDCIKEQPLLIKDGMFCSLANHLKLNQFFPTQELQDIPTDFSGNQFPDCHHTHLILAFNRPHVLDLKVRPWKINQMDAPPPSI